jgi:regulatory protein
MKSWGRIKIVHGLKEKRVSDYCIRKALKEIDDTQYQSSLNKLAAAKWKTLQSEKNIFIRMRKTQDHLLQKGFEPNLINDVLHHLRSGDML